MAKKHDDINLKELRVVEEAATKLWKQYQSESNRLDMMPFDTPEFIQLDKKCDQSREDYYKAHELAEKQFDIYRKVMNKCAHVYYFEMQFLEILIDKIAHIAQSIMAMLMLNGFLDYGYIKKVVILEVNQLLIVLIVVLLLKSLQLVNASIVEV